MSPIDDTSICIVRHLKGKFTEYGLLVLFLCFMEKLRRGYGIRYY